MGKMKISHSDSDALERAKNTAKANKRAPINKKASLIVYVIVLVLAVAARTVQLFSNMDFDRGKYIDPSFMKNYPLLVMIPGFAIIAAILIWGNARDKVISSCILINPMRLRYDRLNKKIPHAAGYSSLFMALLVAVQIVFDFINLVHKNTEYMKTLPREEAEDFNKLTGYNLGMFFTHLLMLFVVLTFVSIAINIFNGVGFSHANCAALSTYAVWKTVEIFKMVSLNTALSTYSGLVYQMLSYMTAVVFFLCTARFFNGMEKKNTRFWMCFMGYVSSILAAVSVIPRYILLLIPTNYDDRLDMSIPEISDVGIVFMTITIVAVFWSTYVYRIMPKHNLGKRRWSKAPISKEFQQMESIDE